MPFRNTEKVENASSKNFHCMHDSGTSSEELEN